MTLADAVANLAVALPRVSRMLSSDYQKAKRVVVAVRDATEFAADVVMVEGRIYIALPRDEVDAVMRLAHDDAAFARAISGTPFFDAEDL